jgi:hypothetical protein
MRRTLPLLLLLTACASAHPPPAAVAPHRTLRQLASELQLQLRRGEGAAPCKPVGGGLEACPVLDEPGGLHFLTTAELDAMGGGEGPPPAEHAYMIGWLWLMSTVGQAELTWVGDDADPHRVAVLSRPGAESFDAARLLALPNRIEGLVDDLGLQFLAAVPDTRTLLLWRDEDPHALALARSLVAERGRSRPPDLVPDRLFVVTPEGIEASTWDR